MPKSCASCGAQVSNDAKFCARCGAATLDDKFREAEIISDQDMDICPACGVALAQEAKFCHNCGNKLEISKKKFCSACGAAYVEDAEFCHKCGKALEAAPQPLTPVPQAPLSQPGYCRKCGKKLSYWNKPIHRKDICYDCFAHPAGKIESVHLNSTGAYERWIRYNGPKVEIIDVQSNRRGWNIKTGFIGSGKVRYMVTFRRK